MGCKPIHFNRLEVFDIVDVFNWIRSAKKKHGHAELAGQSVNLKSIRLKTFLYKGTQCVYCGRLATHFALERLKKVNSLEAHHGHWHLNLYITNDNGLETMMTADHLIPLFAGGKNNINNLVPACRTCNQDKGHNLPEGKWIPRYSFRYTKSKGEYNESLDSSSLYAQSA